jgi:hypothetical protein
MLIVYEKCKNLEKKKRVRMHEFCIVCVTGRTYPYVDDIVIASNDSVVV